jgi:biopolymer transport protein ExbD
MHGELLGPDDEEEGPMFPRKKSEDNADFDITAMIDLVFMMNIYFMVTALVTASAEIALPFASHCTPADKDNAVIISVLADASGSKVYLGEAFSGPVIEPADQEQKITAAIQEKLATGHEQVIIKAEFDVPHKEVSEIMRIANDAGDVQLFLGVHETN